MPSKETLQRISIKVSEINFPEKITVLETGFPRLQKLHLGESVSSGAELSRFCQKISNLRDITLKGVTFLDEGRLEIFLDNMKEIPEGGGFDLHLHVGNIKQEFLIDCLKKYIEDVEVKDRLGIHFDKGAG